MERLLISIDDAGQALGIGRTGVYRLISAGALQRVKVGRRALITSASVRGYCEQLTESEPVRRDEAV